MPKMPPAPLANYGAPQTAAPVSMKPSKPKRSGHPHKNLGKYLHPKKG